MSKPRFLAWLFYCLKQITLLCVLISLGQELAPITEEKYMTKDSSKKIAQLLRDFRRSLRHYSALYDSMQALKDTEGIKVVTEELKYQLANIQKTADQLAELTQSEFKLTLALDLDETTISIQKGESHAAVPSAQGE